MTSAKHIYPEYDNVPVKKPRRIYRFFKRLCDIFLSFFILLLTGWALLIIALIVSISSHGTPLYKDPRIGYKGKEIKILKFRSMVVDANEHPEKYLNKKQMQQFIAERKVDNDPRITKIGKFIRKTSIDELPQLLNIIGGSMTFVGPRPITQGEFDTCFTEKQAKIYQSCRPGLTGLWQVSGRSDIEFSNGERQRVELSYFSKRSFWFDMKIFFKTPIAVLKHRGAK